MNCTQKQQLVSFPKVRIWKSWFRYFNNHKEFRNEGTVHLFSLMALFSYANFRSNERVINGERYMEAPGQWICKLGSLPRILRVHSKRQALEQLDYYEKYGFLTYEWLDEENEIIRFSITNWKEHCTSLYTAFLVPTMLTMFSTRAFAADTIWTKASAIMQDVYTQILGISTIAAVVTAAIALLLMNFSRSGRTVDESRAWLKRIIITWAILNSLGFIMAYVTPFFSGGTWTP